MGQEHEVPEFRSYSEFNLEEIDGIPDLISIVDDRDTLKVELVDRTGERRLLSLSNAVCYRRTEERFMLTALEEMNQFGFLGKFCIILGKSDLKSWILAQSLNTMDDLELQHIRLTFTQDIVDAIIVGPVEIVVIAHSFND